MSGILQTFLMYKDAVANAFGLFGGGNDGNVTTYTDKYTYSDDTVAAGTVLRYEKQGLAACSSTANGL
jgi:hypothetical protein